MKVEFIVNGANNGTANVRTEVNGESINAAAPAFEVELVSVQGNSGLTLRFIGGQANEARETFKPGAKVVGDFTAY